jgi:hypothetical protein
MASATIFAAIVVGLLPSEILLVALVLLLAFPLVEPHATSIKASKKNQQPPTNEIL